MPHTAALLFVALLAARAAAEVKPAPASPCSLLPGGLRLLLRDGETLTGPLVRLDAESLVIRTAWAGSLKVPRGAVAALTQLPGWQPVFEDDFSAGLKGWTVQGRPETRTDPSALQLTNPGQELTWTAPQPLEAGRVGVNFQQARIGQQASCLLELHFQQDKKTQMLGVTLSGPGDGYPTEVAGLEGTVCPVERSPGWHRVSVRFGRRSLRVLVDDQVVWYNLEHGPAGPLTQVRLLCQGNEDERGALDLTAFAVSRSVDEEPHPPGDPTQDEVWLVSGDQLFGQVLTADVRSLTIQGRSGQRTLSWTEVRGLYLRQPAKAVGQLGGGVKVRLHTGLTPEADLLQGEALEQDAERLKLRHPLLGELSIERHWIKRVQP
jgi:hypothetical protein